MGTTHCRLLGGSKDTKQIWSAAEYAVAMEHLKTSAHYSSALPCTTEIVVLQHLRPRN